MYESSRIDETNKKMLKMTIYSYADKKRYALNLVHYFIIYRVLDVLPKLEFIFFVKKKKKIRQIKVRSAL